MWSDLAIPRCQQSVFIPSDELNFINCWGHSAVTLEDTQLCCTANNNSKHCTTTPGITTISHQLEHRSEIIRSQLSHDDEEPMEWEDNIKTDLQVAEQSEYFQLKEKLRKCEQEIMCRICYINKTDILLTMCGHLCCCSKCSKTLKQCPICSEEVVEAVKVYIV